MSGPSRGLFASTRRLLSGGVELLQVRVALLANDVELGALRFFDAIVLALLALAGAVIGIVLLCAAVVLVVQPEHRLLALTVMALCFLAAAGWAFMSARSRLRRSGLAFEATRAELARDVAAFSPRPSK